MAQTKLDFDHLPGLANRDPGGFDLLRANLMNDALALCPAANSDLAVLQGEVDSLRRGAADSLDFLMGLSDITAERLSVLDGALMALNEALEHQSRLIDEMSS